jgi:hypothetical protein
LLESNTKQQECIHHWIIDSPNSHMSSGKCKLCGAVAKFSNTLTGAFMGRYRSEAAPRIEANHLQESSLD